MRLKRYLFTVGSLLLPWTPAFAADPVFAPITICGQGQVVATANQAAQPTTPQTPQAPARPTENQPDMTQPPSTNFGESSPGGTEQAASANPQMLGDSLSYTGGNVKQGGGSMTTTTTTTTTTNSNQMATILSIDNTTTPGAGAAFPVLQYRVTIDPNNIITASVFARNANGTFSTTPIVTSRSSTPFGTTSIPGSALAGFVGLNVPGGAVATSVTPGSSGSASTAGTRFLNLNLVFPGSPTMTLLSQAIHTNFPTTSTSTSSYTSGLPLRSLGGSSFKTSDNDSPRPEDRVFEATDYFTRVLHSVRDDNLGGSAPSVRLAREIFGFEKTFLDGNASVELRVPFAQVHESDGTTFSDFDDITVIGKWAFVNEHEQNRDTVLSVGLALTVPTGPDEVIGVTTINPTIIQPFVGFLFGNRDWFVQGFSEMAFSCSDSVPTVWFNDIGVDYFAYRGTGSITAIVPTLEAHLTTPFGHQGADALPVGVIDTLVLTTGVHFSFAKHVLLTFGYEFPVTGPQPFESEYVMQFNYRF